MYRLQSSFPKVYFAEEEGEEDEERGRSSFSKIHFALLLLLLLLNKDSKTVTRLYHLEGWGKLTGE